MLPTQTRNRRDPVRPATEARPVVPRRAVALAVAAALASPAAVQAAQWEFTPRVALAQIWTDNVDLADRGLEESEWITELRPGFTLGIDGPRAKAKLDYDLQALWFADNSDFNDTYHQLNGSGNFLLLPGTLFLDTSARYDQQNISPGGRISYSNYFETDNRTDAVVFAASPYYTGRWGWADSMVRYQYQGVRYTNTDDTTFGVQDSNTNSISASLGTPAPARGFTWQASGSYSRTEFDTAREFEYGRVELELGMPVGLRTRVTASGGLESDVAEDPSLGGLEASFWYLGFQWDPNELESLSVRVGDRYYGTAVEASYSRRGSRGEFGLQYTEEPTTSAGLQNDPTVFRPDLRPGGITGLDTRVFLQKRFSANASYGFVRSRLSARLYSDRRDFDGAGEQEKAHGATLRYDWDFAARTTLYGSVDYEQRKFGTDRSDDYTELSAGLTRELTRRVSASLAYSHFQRDSDAGEEYRVNQVSLRFNATF